MKKLPARFYTNPNVIDVATSLLGKHLCTLIDGEFTSGIIVETEAYNGVLDKASHAFGARRTARTEVMFKEGGVAYVYLCYGMHYLFNVVTGEEDEPLAVLIRGVEPVAGIDIMLRRRAMKIVGPKVSGGPALLSQALGINKRLNNADLSGDEVWIEDAGLKIKPSEIIATTRIGVAYAAEDSLLPYRFYINGNKFVSRIK